MNYNGRGDIDVSSALARANAALAISMKLSAIINVTRTNVRIFIRCARALALRAGKRSFISLRSNRDQSLLVNFD